MCRDGSCRVGWSIAKSSRVIATIARQGRPMSAAGGADIPPAKVGPRFEPKPVIDPVSVRISAVMERGAGSAGVNLP
jgi:hypothetical protein